MKKPATPFPLTGYYGPDYFCDREVETRKLIANIRGGISTVLTAQRRMGKTSLIMHVLARLPKAVRTVYIDILSTESRNDFLNELATALIRSAADRKGFGSRLWEFIRSLSPTLKFDDLTGAPQVSFLPENQNVNERIEAILNFLEKEDERMVIAIDEFQQILNFPEQNTDALLRTIIQRMKNIVFIFSGSQQHLMNELFTLPARPFYNSSAMLKLGKIAPDKYSEYILNKFRGQHIKLSKEVVSQVLKWTDIHTYYVQLLCGRLYLSGHSDITTEVWKEEASNLIEEHESVFYNYRSMLTKPQWDLLKAVGSEGEVYEPTASDFVLKHALGSPSTVLRSLKALLKMELISIDYNNDGKKFYRMNDLLFRRWVENREN